MTRVSLARIIADELATLRRFDPGRRPSGKARRVEWSEKLPGFGIRYYGSGRSTYIVQSRMNGVTRTITLGNANVLSKSQALNCARRILLRAQVGEDPASKRKEVRKVPTYDDFLAIYWKQAAAKWKPSTCYTHACYRRLHLDQAFSGMFIDEIEQSHVLTWFNKVSVNGGPGAGNRCFEILRSMFNHAERWGMRPEGSNHLKQSLFTHLYFDLRLRQREHDLRDLLVDLQLGRAEVGLVALGKAKGEYGPLLVAKEDQRSVTAGLASAFTRDALLDQSAAEIGIDQSAIGLIDGGNKRRFADPFPARELREPAVLVDAGSRVRGLPVMDRHFDITHSIMVQ